MSPVYQVQRHKTTVIPATEPESLAFTARLRGKPAMTRVVLGFHDLRHPYIKYKTQNGAR